MLLKSINLRRTSGGWKHPLSQQVCLIHRGGIYCFVLLGMNIIVEKVVLDVYYL